MNDVLSKNYQSNIVSLTRSEFSEFQYNVFFAVVSQVNKGKQQWEDSEEGAKNLYVRFHKDDIENFNVRRDPSAIEESIRSIMDLKVQFDEDEGVGYGVIFPYANYNQGQFTLMINPRCIPAFNELKKKYHYYYLREAMLVPGKYLKKLYQILHAQKYLKEWCPSIQEFREVLNIPKSYQTTHIRDILKKAVKVFHENTSLSFTVETSKVGRKIGYIKFLNIVDNNQFAGELQEDIEILTNEKEERYLATTIKMLDAQIQNVLRLTDGCTSKAYKNVKRYIYNTDISKIKVLHAFFMKKLEEEIAIHKAKEEQTPKREDQVIWDKCLKVLKKEARGEEFDKWFKPIKSLKYDQQTLTIEIPKKEFYDFIEDFFIDTIQVALIEITGNPHVKFEYCVLPK